MKSLCGLSLILLLNYKIEASEEVKFETNAVNVQVMTLEEKKESWNTVKDTPDPELKSQKINLILSIALDPKATVHRQKEMINALEKLDPTRIEEKLKIWIFISKKKRRNPEHCIWAARMIMVLTGNLTHSPIPTKEVNEAWERVAIHPFTTLADKIEAGQRSYTKIPWQAVHDDKDAKEYHKSHALDRIRMMEENK